MHMVTNTFEPRKVAIITVADSIYKLENFLYIMSSSFVEQSCSKGCTGFIVHLINTMNNMYPTYSTILYTADIGE